MLYTDTKSYIDITHKFYVAYGLKILISILQYSLKYA